jgi:hypothetical protein
MGPEMTQTTALTMVCKLVDAAQKKLVQVR